VTEKVPRQPVPQVAVVKALPTTRPEESTMSTVTLASKTLALPATVTGFETACPIAGLVTRMTGRRSR
jgi:hypothetical protein